MYRSGHTYKRVVGTLVALLAAVVLAGPALAQVQNNFNAATQTTTATSGAQATGTGVGIGTGGAATVTGSGNSDASATVEGSGNSKNKNDNTLTNNPDTSLTVTSTGAPNLIQLPGLLGAYPNFTQPYQPPAWLNGASVVLPAEMTYAQAKACRGDAKSDDKRRIKLYYVREQKIAQQPDFSAYTGDYWIETKDEPYMKGLCKAATEAMEDGAGVGVVSSIVKPKNKTYGVMLGASFGGSGMPAGGANPYALAGVLGGGVGWSNTEVEGKLMLQLTGFKDATVLRTSDGRMLNAETTASARVTAPAPALVERPAPPVMIQGGE